jgi:uncharacterized membrane protein YhfC
MLIAMIILATIFMFALPLVLALILTKRYNATWRTIGVGVLAYLVTQSVLMLLAWGLQSLLQNQLSTEIAGLSLTTILSYALAWLSCIFAILTLWFSFHYLKKEGDSWIGALALGVGFGGAESFLMGFEAISVFYPYVVSVIAGVQSLGLSASDASALTNSLSSFLATPWYFPLTYVIDRAAYLSVYLAVTVVVWQALTKHKRMWLWLVGGAVWLIFVQTLNNIVANISTASYWTELFLFVVMLISLEAMYWYKVSVLDKQSENGAKPETGEVIESISATSTETVEPTGDAKPRRVKKNK